MAESTSSTSATSESEKTTQPAPQAPLDTIPAWKWKGSLLVFVLTTLINGYDVSRLAMKREKLDYGRGKKEKEGESA
ncbi:hypothetical protein BJX68DRAFT_266138 [Aspergillus pseudodeflectus]|uniref:Uncharacterized protein n=1 Tax=Aspergillus pseudodeflectus TaxID=176178 RepID=A0ABR4KJ39_9EURO